MQRGEHEVTRQSCLHARLCRLVVPYLPIITTSGSLRRMLLEPEAKVSPARVYLHLVHPREADSTGSSTVMMLVSGELSSASVA